jgi:ribosomal protein S18 acetylase RimI-like enzyme
VAKTSNKPVGFAKGSVTEYPLEVSERFGTIDDLYVLPEFRGRGVGRKLVVESLKTLKARSVKAVRLYRRLGFKNP